MKSKTNFRNLLTYFILAYAISWVIAIPLAVRKTINTLQP